MNINQELVYIGDIGFMFEVKHSLKYNLIGPAVLDFFEGVPENEEVTADCAFPPFIPHTNLRQSIFKEAGYDWAVCSDGLLRKCRVIHCTVMRHGANQTILFCVDNSLISSLSVGIIG